MRFLADENIHGEVVAWLRVAGHDVIYAAETLTGAADEILLASAQRDRRILVTDDKDFGELVFRRKLANHGVLLIRLTSPSVEQRLKRLTQVWAAIQPHLEGGFVVVGDNKVRMRPIQPRR